MLAELQRGLELLYRVDTELDVRDFIIDEQTRDATIGAGRPAREQLLVSERDGELDLGLFLDQRALAGLELRDPRRCLDDGNLSDFLLVTEGVSHFVYLAWRARAARPVSVLELELQAEIDKWVTCVLTLIDQGGVPPDLHARLFERFQLAPGMDAEETERYLVANANARAYTSRLGERYVARGDIMSMLAELRWFYRRGCGDKLAYIAKAA
jgi:hypothetical protein